MKKIFVFAAMMLATVFTFVSCDKGTEPEPTWETPTSLVGTEWFYEAGTTFSYTLIFETETTGVKKCHNDLRPVGGELFDSQRDILSYSYANGQGQYTDDLQRVFDFSIEGGTLTEYDSTIDDYLTYKRIK